MHRRSVGLGKILAMATAIVGLFVAAIRTPAMPVRSKLFDQCAVCHSTDGSNGTGPTLKGIAGRRSGSVEGFRYSRAMKLARITWDEKALDQYLADPQAFIPGNIMPFSGVSDAAERVKIVAYLISLR